MTEDGDKRQAPRPAEEPFGIGLTDTPAQLPTEGRKIMEPPRAEVAPVTAAPSIRGMGPPSAAPPARPIGEGGPARAEPPSPRVPGRRRAAGQLDPSGQRDPSSQHGRRGRREPEERGYKEVPESSAPVDDHPEEWGPLPTETEAEASRGAARAAAASASPKREGEDSDNGSGRGGGRRHGRRRARSMHPRERGHGPPEVPQEDPTLRQTTLFSEELRGAGANTSAPAVRQEHVVPPEQRDQSADDVSVELPSWVEPETEEPGFPVPQKGRPELLPAGAGIDPGPEERMEPAPEPVTSHKRILINADDPEEVRIALLENGRLEELHYERLNEKKYLGNIYKGRIVNLEPAIQAAFVDIGIGRNGFLHVSDVLPAYKEAQGVPMESLSVRGVDRRRLKIQDILRKGQEVLVQISKDAIGAKGPSLTTYVSVPGKYLVLMPGVNRHGISKRINDGEERAKLRESLTRLDLAKGMGYIVRTAGKERPQADLEKDFQYLMRIWDEIRANVDQLPVPALVYEETDLVIRTMRDLFGVEVEEILVDDEAVHERARKFLVDVMPQASGKLKHYTGVTPVFSKFGVEEEIEKIYNRRVPLPSGGYIVVEQTEALVAIDVNSGKYRDEEDLEATALKTNLEAAQEIARQLRLRDLGGVIVNDFIDMESEVNRRAVERALRAALKRDRSKSWISRISRFGIVEMTRQRVRPSFERSNHEPCKFCRGTGNVKSARSLGIAILRQVRSHLAVKRRETCEVVAHPAVVDYLLNERRSTLVDLEKAYQKSVLVRMDPSFGPEQYVIRYH